MPAMSEVNYWTEWLCGLCLGDGGGGLMDSRRSFWGNDDAIRKRVRRVKRGSCLASSHP